MLPRVMRASTAAAGRASVTAGSTSVLSPPAPTTGKTCQVRPNSKISNMPDQNVGIDKPAKAVVMALRSIQRRDVAAKTPTATPTITASTVAPMARLIVEPAIEMISA